MARQIADESAEAAVCRLLEDPDSNVSAAAADALGVIGTSSSGAALRMAALAEGAELGLDQLVTRLTGGNE